jgi:AraC-like DNA-binding protein
MLQKKFDICSEASKKSVYKILKESTLDAAVICLNSGSKREIIEFREIEIFAGFLPLLVCTYKLNHDFFLKAAEIGIYRLLSPEMETEKIILLINDAINQNDLNKFIERKFPGCFEKTPYANKVIKIIIRYFPQKLSRKEISKKLNISSDWLHEKCKEAFNISYTKLVRTIRVYYATRLIYRTNLDNSEIALSLNYTEESSLARDFRKVLNLSPTEIRKKLFNTAPQRLFDNCTLY